MPKDSFIHSQNMLSDEFLLTMLSCNHLIITVFTCVHIQAYGVWFNITRQQMSRIQDTGICSSTAVESALNCCVLIRDASAKPWKGCFPYTQSSLGSINTPLVPQLTDSFQNNITGNLSHRW